STVVSGITSNTVTGSPYFLFSCFCAFSSDTFPSSTSSGNVTACGCPSTISSFPTFTVVLVTSLDIIFLIFFSSYLFYVVVILYTYYSTRLRNISQQYS